MRRWVTGWVGALAAGLLLLGGAVIHHQVMAGRMDQRVTTGRAVTATVAESRWNGVLPDQAVVRYQVASRTYQATLNALFLAPEYATGQRVTVYADRAHPTSVATADGYTSESWWLLVPPLPVGAAGAVIAAVAAGQPARRWWEARGEPEPVLDQPAAEQPDAAEVPPLAVQRGDHGRSGGGVAFDRVRHGYDVQDVQTFLRWFDRVLASGDPHEWERARTALRLTTFRIQFRGYDRQQVRDHVATLADRLRRVSGQE